jgi:hypothetical protein
MKARSPGPARNVDWHGAESHGVPYRSAFAGQVAAEVERLRLLAQPGPAKILGRMRQCPSQNLAAHPRKDIGSKLSGDALKPD